jgi:hypothetical protein
MHEVDAKDAQHRKARREIEKAPRQNTHGGPAASPCGIEYYRLKYEQSGIIIEGHHEEDQSQTDDGGHDKRGMPGLSF